PTRHGRGTLACGNQDLARGRRMPRGKDSVTTRPRSLYSRPGRKVGSPRGAMLVLTRKSNQSIMIGDEIEVSVLAIMGEKVRIGIEAPRSIPVFRKEVYLEIQQDTRPEEARQEVYQA